MSPRSESSPESAMPSTDTLGVKAFLNSRTPVLKLHGSYTFDDLKTVEPVSCDWEVRQEVAGLSVRGHLSGVVTLECARCLEPFDIPVEVDLDERYVLDRYVETTERERELQAEDFYEVVEEEGELDLKDLAHQFLVMETAELTTCGRPDCHVH